MKTCTTVRAWDKKAKAHVDAKVSVELDLQAVANLLGPKAYANKSKVAKFLGGLIVVKVL